MPLGAARLIAPGDKPPTYGDLLSPGRFVLRYQFLKKQAAQLMKHPLFHQIALHSPFTNEGTKKQGKQHWLGSMHLHRTTEHYQFPFPYGNRSIT